MYNPYTEGHYFEYFYHLLLAFSKAGETSLSLCFCIPFEYKEKINELTFEVSSDADFYFVEQGAKKVESGKELELVNAICNEYGISEIFFPHIERARQLIGLLDRSRYCLHGILFYPFSRISFKNQSVFHHFVKTPIVRLQSIITTYKIFFNRRWGHVFLLNDRKSIDLYQGLPFLRSVFEFIPDPIPQFASLKVETDFRKHYNVKDDEKLFVALGYLSKRKNIERLVLAVRAVNDSFVGKIKLLVAGGGDKEYIDYLRTIVEHDPNVIIENKFLEEAEFTAVIKAADVVAIPYLDFFWSSGLLNHAVFHKKKILASNIGLVSESVVAYGLGEVVNPYKLDSIEQGVRNLVTKEHLMKVADFRKDKTPFSEKFGNTIVSRLLGC